MAWRLQWTWKDGHSHAQSTLLPAMPRFHPRKRPGPDGSVEVYLNDNDIAAELASRAKERALEAAAYFVLELKKNLSSFGTGRTYQSRSGANVEHTASDIGEYPAVDLGEMRDSIDYRDTGRHIVEVGARVWRNLQGERESYPAILELKKPVKGGRPWFLRTAREHEGKLKEILSKGWTNERS